MLSRWFAAYGALLALTLPRPIVAAEGVSGAGACATPMRSRAAWSPGRVTEAIRRLSAKFPLNPHFLLQGSPALESELREILGWSSTGAQLYHAGRRHFGRDWRNAIVAAGLDPSDVYRYRSAWTPERVARRWEELQRWASEPATRRGPMPRFPAAAWPDELLLERLRELDRAGFTLDPDRFGDEHEELNRALRSGLPPVAIFVLHDEVVHRFGGWRKALIAAGLDLKRHLGTERDRRGNPKLWGPERAVRLLQALAAAGLALDPTSLLGGESSEEAARLLAAQDPPTTPGSLYVYVRLEKGSWWEGLRAAGLNPLEHRRRIPRSVRAGALPTQRERVDLGDGRSELRQLVGWPSATPEEQLLGGWHEEAAAEAVRELPARDRELGRRILIAILDDPEILGGEGLIANLASELSPQGGAAEIERTLGELRGTRALQGLLGDAENPQAP